MGKAEAEEERPPWKGQKVMNTPAELLLIWLGVLSIIAFLLMGLDKLKACRGSWRIPERTLFLFALLGGGIGGTLGMYLFRHKTRHWYFAIFFPLLAVLQAALCVFIMIKF